MAHFIQQGLNEVFHASSPATHPGLVDIDPSPAIATTHSQSKQSLSGPVGDGELELHATGRGAEEEEVVEEFHICVTDLGFGVTLCVEIVDTPNIFFVFRHSFLLSFGHISCREKPAKSRSQCLILKKGTENREIGVRASRTSPPFLQGFQLGSCLQRVGYPDHEGHL